MSFLNTLTNGKLVTAMIIVIFAAAFFIQDQYLFSFLSIILLVLILRLEDLKKLIVNKGGLTAEFDIPEENIKKDIRENEEIPTEEKITQFRKIEEWVLTEVARKLGGEMKKQITIVSRQPDWPQFSYKPDAIIQTEERLIFVDVIYVRKRELATKIVQNAARLLSQIVESLRPSAGKPLVAKLILVSDDDFSNIDYDTMGIELEFYNTPSNLRQ